MRDICCCWWDTPGGLPIATVAGGQCLDEFNQVLHKYSLFLRIMVKFRIAGSHAHDEEEQRQEIHTLAFALVLGEANKLEAEPAECQVIEEGNPLPGTQPPVNSWPAHPRWNSVGGLHYPEHQVEPSSLPSLDCPDRSKYKLKSCVARRAHTLLCPFSVCCLLVLPDKKQLL